MPPKKASATGAGTLQPLDPNQDILSLREARSQKRKAVSPTPPEDDLDQEIQNLEILQQQVQRKKEKMARLADLLSHPVLEGKPNANYVRARIRTHVHSDYINEHHHTMLE
jgi:hypothetical protein